MREDIITARKENAEKLKSEGVELYPTWHGRTHGAAEIRAEADELLETEKEITAAGRIVAKREHGNTAFMDLRDSSGKIQLLLKSDEIGEENYKLIVNLDIGDLISATGALVKTKAGELSVQARSWKLLAKSFVPLPDKWAGLQNTEKRARQRELDLIVNEKSKETFVTRALLIQAIRNYLERNGFMAVETPILQDIPGGASARPFVTHHNALDLDLYLRISPELYLKRLVVGGMERVYELSRCFRNEGIDRQHNPEFTMCEFYMAYATVNDLIPFTEELFTNLFTTTGRGPRLSYQGQELDLTPPWKQVTFADAIKEATEIDPLETTDLKTYLDFLRQNNIPLPEVKTPPVVLDTVYKEVVRKQNWEPVIIKDFPIEMEPLAKRCPHDERLVQRIQLLAAGMELLKAYTELNDPAEQEKRFKEQEGFRESGDKEAQVTDEKFLEALKIGLPPTAGWGMGIDRLAMLMTDTNHIRDVITFPLLRPNE